MSALSRRRFVLVSVATLGAPRASLGQAQRAVRKVAVLMPSTPALTVDLIAALEQGLRENGYQPGTNLVVEYRYTDGNAARVMPLAVELEDAGAEIIVTTTDQVVRTVEQHTRAVSIVMVNASDPVANGLVRTLARPGGRITGLTNLSPEITGKRIELLKECVPALTRVAYLWNPNQAGAQDTYEQLKSAAARLSLALQSLQVREESDIPRAFDSISATGATALLVQAPNPMLYTRRAEICALANSRRLPSMFNRIEYLAEGGLMSYGPSVRDMYREAGAYVDKILKGARAADLPVAQPTKFELALNLRAARQLALNVPQPLLARVDRLLD